MATWDNFCAAAPELAADVQRRFEATGLAIVATLRRDGSPRISAIETFIGGGELWLGMMGGSLKARDLQRDPRIAVHSATVDKEVREGDAKLSGRAIEVTDPDELKAFVGVVNEQMGADPPPPFHAFRIDVTEASFLRPAGDHLDIDVWREGSPPRRVERR
jgi:hypothetical protein